MNIILENIRCFAGRHVVPLHHLTVLTGENSTGKSTFLAMLAALFDKEGYPFQPRFNEAPYNLGGYDTIATYKGGSYGRADYFKLGFSSEENNTHVESTYVERSGEPEFKRLEVETPQGNLVFEYTDMDSSPRKAYIWARTEDMDYESDFEIPDGLRRMSEGSSAGVLVMIALSQADSKDDIKGSEREFRDILHLAFSVVPGQALSLAPIRTKPRRTYGQVIDRYEPTGEHIPSVLAKIFREESSKDKREEVFKSIEEFGRDSGLFHKFKIKKLGRKITDPFQVMVKGEGRWANLVDVGYGVSQVLPIIAQSILASEENVLLLQQPEVHLHPKAQAALGTFFSRIASTEDQYTIIETHSDYILDRVRREIADDVIDNSTMALLFFEKDGVESSINHIDIDSDGNVVDTPDSYRRFFLEEEVSILNRGMA